MAILSPGLQPFITTNSYSMLHTTCNLHPSFHDQIGKILGFLDLRDVPFLIFGCFHFEFLTKYSSNLENLFALRWIDVYFLNITAYKSQINYSRSSPN